MKGGVHPVVVTGLGVISPVGEDPEEAFQRLCRGQSGIRRIRHFDTGAVPCNIGGVVEGFDARRYIGDRETLRDVRCMDRVHQWGLCAAQRAVADAGLEDELMGPAAASRVDRARVGVYVGTGLSGRDLVEQLMRQGLDAYRQVAGPLPPQRPVRAGGSAAPDERLIGAVTGLVMREINPLAFLQQCPSIAAAYIAMRYRAMGPNVTIVSLCAASAQAIGEGAWAVARGDADVVLAGGTDSMLNPVDLTAFCKLSAVTGRDHEVEEASKPFDLRRDGCVVGEGAAFLVLESAENARRRGARIYAELAGYGSSADAYKVSAPPEDGEGARLSMERAMARAEVRPEQVGHVNAHGTSTSLNDRIETHAIKRALGDHAYRVPVVSTKSMTGHLIAAAGALEALVSIKSLQHQRVPPTINLKKPDPLCDLDYVSEGARSVPGLDVVLSNSFAIGGVNATLIFKRWPA